MILIDPVFRIGKNYYPHQSFFRTGKNYYPQVFLEECKYVVKEKKMPEYITDDIEISSDDSDREHSNEENSDEENYNKEN